MGEISSEMVDAEMVEDFVLLADATPYNEIPAGGTDDYNDLTNKPSIESAVLVGDRSLKDIGVGVVTEQMIDNLIFG